MATFLVSIISCFDIALTRDFFALPQNDLWNASFQLFAPARWQSKVALVQVDTFPTDPGSALILATPHLSWNHTYCLPSTIIGVCGLNLRTKKWNKKGLFWSWVAVYAITFHSPLNISFFLRHRFCCGNVTIKSVALCNLTPPSLDGVVRITIGRPLKRLTLHFHGPSS